MYRRRRWKSRGTKKLMWKNIGTIKLGWKKITVILAIIVVFMAIFTFTYVEKHLREPLLSIAKVRIKQIGTEAINMAISERISQTTDLDKLVDWRVDMNGKVTGFVLNYAEHMRISADTVDVVQETLDQLHRIPDYVPIGQAFNSVLLATYGPDIKVRFIPEGAVKIDLKTRQSEAGINNILVEVYMRVMTEVTIIIPFSTDTETLVTEVPISYILISGDVPMYYFDNKGQMLNGMGQGGINPPPIALPNMGQPMRR